jgi:hypothetical protein
MASEAQLRVSLRIYKKSGNVVVLSYQNQGTAFNPDVTGSLGPTPGAFVAGTLGTDVDLSQLSTPGLAWIRNLDPTNYVTIGIYDPEADKFLPLGELLPGEGYVLRLSREFGVDFSPATGTGTSAATNRLRVRADTAPCNVLVEAFEA